MRILFVTPYPPSHVRVRSYGFLKQLQRQHDVTVMLLCRSEREMADAEQLRSQGYDVMIVQESRQQALLRSGLALASTHSLHVAYAKSARFIQSLHRLCSQRHFDVVHVEHLRGIAAVEHLAFSYPLVWDAVDCISLLYKQTIVSGPSLLTRSVAMLEHKRVQVYEAKLLSKLQHVVVTSELDRQAMIDLQRIKTRDVTSDDSQLGSSINVLPNGVDLEYFYPLQQERKCFNLVFSGKMNYHPNVATALYLCQRIMPLIWERRPEATLTIVGAEPPVEIQRLASNQPVEVTGFVDDLRPYIRQAEVMLCPMVYGTGIQNKVLEAMALGTPVVVTPKTAAALNVCPDRDLLVAESPQQFADATLHLMENAALRATLSHNGRAYVEQHHDWQVVAGKMVSIYEHAIATYAGKYDTQYTSKIYSMR